MPETETCTKCKVTWNIDGGTSCPSCGVDHSEPCPECRQAGYHADGCTEVDE